MTWPRRQWTSKLRGFPGAGMGGPATRPPPLMGYPGPLLSAFTYSPSALVLTHNVAMAPLVPTILPVGTPIVSFRMTPDPPAGLSFSQTTGVLSGTPTTVQAIKSYTMRALAGAPYTWPISITVT